MSKKRMFDTRFWSDVFVVDHLNPLDKLLYLYLLLNERVNLIGIYELSVRTAAFETGIDRDTIEKMLQRLSPKIEYFDGWIYIRRFADHQQHNPSIEIGMKREVAALPAPLRKKIIENGIVSEVLARAFNSLGQPVTESERVADTKPILNLTKPYGIYVPPAAPATPVKSTISRNELLTKLNAALHGSSQMTITKGRLDKLSARLKTFSAKQLLAAAELIGNDGYLQGDNDAGKRYGTIDYLLRNDEIIAKQLEQTDGQPSKGSKGLTEEELERAYKNL